MILFSTGHLDISVMMSSGYRDPRGAFIFNITRTYVAVESYSNNASFFGGLSVRSEECLDETVRGVSECGDAVTVLDYTSNCAVTRAALPLSLSVKALYVQTDKINQVYAMLELLGFPSTFGVYNLNGGTVHGTVNDLQPSTIILMGIYVVYLYASLETLFIYLLGV